MFREVADIQTAETLNLPVPKANFHNVVITPSDLQLEMVAELAERAEMVRNKEVKPHTDNMLCITNDGRKLALDQRLMNSMLPDHEGNKTSVAADNIFRHWEDGNADKLTQLVFCDLSTPDGSAKSPFEMKEVEGVFVIDDEQFYNVYEDLRKKLILKGIPDDEIAFIHEANTETKRKELLAKVRQGKVRVLMGSTFKCGSGMNVQDRLIAIHRLDCPWRPSDIAQQNGRGIRQGNMNPEVHIYTYITEKTFDGYSYQLIENKQRFIAQIMTSKSPVRSAEDIDEQALSYAEIKALATGNPLIIEKCDLEMQVSRLNLIKSSFLSQKYALEDKILKHYPAEIKRLTGRSEGYKVDIATVKNNPIIKDVFSMTVAERVYTDKKAAGTAILAECKALKSKDSVPLGSYRGFDMELYFNSFSKDFGITIKGTITHNVNLGIDIHGNITRIDNVLDGMEPKMNNIVEQLKMIETQMETAKIEVEKPFSQESELTEKSERLNQINIELNLDKKENEIVEAEPDEGDNLEQPDKKKDRGHER